MAKGPPSPARPRRSAAPLVALLLVAAPPRSARAATDEAGAPDTAGQRSFGFEPTVGFQGGANVGLVIFP